MARKRVATSPPPKEPASKKQKSGSTPATPSTPVQQNQSFLQLLNQPSQGFASQQYLQQQLQQGSFFPQNMIPNAQMFGNFGFNPQLGNAQNVGFSMFGAAPAGGFGAPAPKPKRAPTPSSDKPKRPRGRPKLERSAAEDEEEDDDKSQESDSPEDEEEDEASEKEKPERKASAKPKGRPPKSAGAAASSSAPKSSGPLFDKKKRMFTKELRTMMYGFGDVANPMPETVDLMEDLVLEFVGDITSKAMKIATKRGKLQTDDFVFLIRKDRKKYARVEELLKMYEELKKARKAFDADDSAL